jgi:hypothetical protein
MTAGSNRDELSQEHFAFLEAVRDLQQSPDSYTSDTAVAERLMEIHTRDPRSFTWRTPNPWSSLGPTARELEGLGYLTVVTDGLARATLPGQPAQAAPTGHGLGLTDEGRRIIEERLGRASG